MQINGKRIVITGAASGIGAALLRRLVKYEAQVIAVDKQSFEPPTGKAVVQVFIGDLGTPETVDTLFEQADAHMGGIDLFIANAGFAYYGRANGVAWHQIESIYRVNVFSPLYALQKMQALNPERPYTVVLTASAMALLPLAAGYAHYTATKAALHAFATTYRLEKPANAHLMATYPIATRTGFFGNAPRLRPLQSPDYVARRIVNGIEKDKKAVHPSPGFLGYLYLGRVLPFLYSLFRRYTTWVFHRWEQQRHIGQS